LDEVVVTYDELTGKRRIFSEFLSEKGRSFGRSCIYIQRAFPKNGTYHQKNFEIVLSFFDPKQ